MGAACYKGIIPGIFIAPGKISIRLAVLIQGDIVRAKANFLVSQPPMLTMEELWRGKEAGGKENLADFWLMASEKSEANRPSEAPCRKGVFTSISASPKRQGRKAPAAVRRRRLQVRQ